jgi:hypothetical protein
VVYLHSWVCTVRACRDYVLAVQPAFIHCFENGIPHPPPQTYGLHTSRVIAAPKARQVGRVCHRVVAPGVAPDWPDGGPRGGRQIYRQPRRGAHPAGECCQWAGPKIAVPKRMCVGCARLHYVCRGCTNELGGISACAIKRIWVMSADLLYPASFSMPMLASIWM